MTPAGINKNKVNGTSDDISPECDLSSKKQHELAADVRSRGLHFLFALAGCESSFGSAGESSCVTRSNSNENYVAIALLVETAVCT